MLSVHHKRIKIRLRSMEKSNADGTAYSRQSFEIALVSKILFYYFQLNRFVLFIKIWNRELWIVAERTSYEKIRKNLQKKNSIKFSSMSWVLISFVLAVMCLPDKERSVKLVKLYCNGSGLEKISHSVEVTLIFFRVQFVQTLSSISRRALYFQKTNTA